MRDFPDLGGSAVPVLRHLLPRNPSAERLYTFLIPGETEDFPANCFATKVACPDIFDGPSSAVKVTPFNFGSFLLGM